MQMREELQKKNKTHSSNHSLEKRQRPLALNVNTMDQKTKNGKVEQSLCQCEDFYFIYLFIIILFFFNKPWRSLRRQ